MIKQVTTQKDRRRFYKVCQGKLCMGATLPLALELFGKSQPGRFFAGPTLALDIGGSTAWMAGHALTGSRRRTRWRRSFSRTAPPGGMISTPSCAQSAAGAKPASGP